MDVSVYDLANTTFYVVSAGLLLLGANASAIVRLTVMIAGVYILKVATEIERPNKRDQLSFPSGHSAVAWYIAAGIYHFNPFVTLWAALVSYARVQAGEHWPSDVIAGAIIGIISVYCK